MEPAGKLSRAGLLVATIPEMINFFRRRDVQGGLRPSAQLCLAGKILMMLTTTSIRSQATALSRVPW